MTIFVGLLWQPKLSDQDIEFALDTLRSNDSVSYVWQKAPIFSPNRQNRIFVRFVTAKASLALAELADFVVNNVYDSKHAPQSLLTNEKPNAASQVAQATGG